MTYQVAGALISEDYAGRTGHGLKQRLHVNCECLAHLSRPVNNIFALQPLAMPEHLFAGEQVMWTTQSQPALVCRTTKKKFDRSVHVSARPSEGLDVPVKVVKAHFIQLPQL